ncbi:MAG: hypothetical protein HQM08_04040 [Candidatus Riflebacteria bacterium]|nr:hypothetical protein [Candidatus Riflebacteria bacterium]
MNNQNQDKNFPWGLQSCSAFWDAYLKGDTDAKEWLEGSGPSSFSGKWMIVGSLNDRLIGRPQLSTIEHQNESEL